MSAHLDSTEVRIVAHRGARGLCDSENTVAAFEMARELGARWIEFDVRRTGDGELVCFHDPDHQGTPLGELTYAALAERARKEGYEVPRVEDVFRRFRGTLCMDIELKEAGYERELVVLAQRYLGRDRFVMKSFIDSAVAGVKEADPSVKTGLLLGVEGSRFDVRKRVPEVFPELRLARVNADFVSPNVGLIRLGFMQRMRRVGVEVWVWTVNEPDTMARLVKIGVDAIITDRPDLGLKILNETRRGGE